jgi:hypothetical protein
VRYRVTFEISADEIDHLTRTGILDRPPKQIRIETPPYEDPEMLAAKLEFVLARTPVEDGVYTFPDGDSWPAGSAL